MELSYNHCPICKSGNVKPLYKIGDFDIEKCGNCSVVFVGNKLELEYLTNYYNSQTIDHSIYINDNITYLNRYYRKLKNDILRITGLSSGKILDVGCSHGYFLDVMDNWECHGIEISKSDAAVAALKHGDNIFNGVIETYPVKPSYFDVITLQDVLDHCIDPVKVIAICNKMLKPGGLLILKVHDIDCLYARVTGKNFYAIIPPVHLFYFSKKPLSFLLNTNGYKILEYKHIGQTIKLKTIFYRFARNNTRSLFYKIYSLLSKLPAGDIPVYKNLHDIITVFAVKV